MKCMWNINQNTLSVDSHKKSKQIWKDRSHAKYVLWPQSKLSKKQKQLVNFHMLEIKNYTFNRFWVKKEIAEEI